MPYYDELKTLITNHLEDLEHNRMPIIQRKTGYTLEQIQEVLQELRKLKPKPGRIFKVSSCPTSHQICLSNRAKGGVQGTLGRHATAEFVH